MIAFVCFIFYNICVKIFVEVYIFVCFGEYAKMKRGIPMKKKHFLSLCLVAALLLCAVAVGMAPQAKADETHSHCICGGNLDAHALEMHNANDGACSVVEWTPVSTVDDINAMLVAGGYQSTSMKFADNTVNIYLTANITLTSILEVDPGQTVNICLNGHKLTGVESNRTVNVLQGRLNICDCVGGGIVTGNKNGTPYYMYTGGKIALYGGTMTTTNTSTTNNYGLLYVGGDEKTISGTDYDAGGAEFYVYGGCVDASKLTVKGPADVTVTTNGTVMYAFSSGGKVQIHGGSVKGGTASKVQDGTTNRANSAAISMTSGIAFTMTGGEIVGGKATDGIGGAIYMTAGTLNITGGKISGASARLGGAIYAKAGTVNLSNCEITNCTATNGGVVYMEAGAANISNAKITNCSADVGGVVYLAAGTASTKPVTLTVTDTEIAECTSTTGNAGAIFAKNCTTVTLAGTTNIHDCSSAASSGAVFMDSTTNATLGIAKITMKDSAKIENCKALNGNGGGVSLNFQSVLDMQDNAKISGCTATNQGGNVQTSCYARNDASKPYLHSTVNMTGNAVIENGESNRGGNIYATSSVDVNLSGNAVIADGHSGNGGNIYLAYNTNKYDNLTYGGVLNMTGDSRILGGVSTGNGGSLYFNKACSVTLDDNAAIMGTAEHPATAPVGGCVAIGGASTLTLNGHSFISGGTATTGAGGTVYAEGGTITLNDYAAIKDGTAGTNGGCLYMKNDGTTCTMNDNAEISGGTTKAGQSGGCVALSTKALLTMEGGKISGGHVVDANGGNIVLFGDAVFTMNAGELADGWAEYKTKNGYGGNVYSNGAGAVINFVGGTISGGTAAAGGNAYMDTAATWNVGAVSFTGGTGVKYSEKSGGNGGNIYVAGTIADKVKFDGTIIKEGTARAGGNVAAFGAVKMENVTISDGTAESQGNIFVYNNGNLTLKNCTVENGTTTSGGAGNIGMSNDKLQATTLVLDNTTIGSATMPKDQVGAGVNVGNGTLILIGNVVIDSGADDIYVNYSDYRYRYVTIDAALLDTEDTITLNVPIDGIFATGTDAQTGVFEAVNKEEGSTYVCSCVDGNLYMTKTDAVLIKDKTGNVVNTYRTLKEALNALEANQYIFLQDDLYENTTFSGSELYVDLNGYRVHGVVTMNQGAVLYGTNSKTDKYESDNGFFSAELGEGTVAKHMKAFNLKRYLATSKSYGETPAAGAKDQTYTRYYFDRFYIGISAITLNPYTGEIGYTGKIGGNANVQAALADENAFGYKLTLEGNATATTGSAKADFVTGSTGNTLTLTIQNQLEAVNEDPSLAPLKVTATMFITLADGTVIESAPYAYSIIDMFKLVDNGFNGMSASAKASMKNLYTEYEVMKDWNLTNLAAYAA